MCVILLMAYDDHDTSSDLPGPYRTLVTAIDVSIRKTETNKRRLILL